MLKRVGAVLAFLVILTLGYADVMPESTEATPPPPSSRTVEAIVIRFSGVSAVSEALTRSHIELKEGQAYSQAALDRSVKSLLNTGYFETVLATPEERNPGKVTALFDINPKPKIRTISFEGNRAIKSKNLQKELKLKPNSVLGSQELNDAVKKLKDFYGQRNYPDVTVVARTTPLASAGLVDVTFVVNEGKKTKVKDIRFVGNHTLKAKELKEVMVTRKDGWLSFVTGSGKLDEEKTSDDLTRLAELYRNKGFLEVKVTGPQVAPYGEGIVLTYVIEEGTRYQMGEQTVEGNTLFTTQQLQKGFKAKKGKPYSPAAVDASVKALRDIYGTQGYLQTIVMPQMVPGKDPKTLDVKYTIKESQQFSVGTINIAGNTNTKNIVVARELLLAPGDVFSSSKMKTSEERLKNTNYFTDVKITDEPSQNSSAEHDMNVSVTEGKTGNLSLGVGFGSLDRASIFAEVTQSNFDITNYRNMFRGGGQKARLYLSLAERSNQAIVNFEEPWLFQRRIAGGFSLYRTETEYYSSKYNERRAGFEVYLRKRLVELIDGRLGYRRENVTLYDIADDASAAIQAEAGERSVSKMTLSFTRDTRDKVTFTTRGNRLELNTAWAGNGFGGDTEYWSVEARAAQYFPSFQWPVPQTMILLARAGTMDGFNGKSVPLFDRFFLGGPSTLRGFGYRKVGPTDASGEPLGGNSYGFWSFEYAWQVAPILQIATFYDAGFVNSGTSDFSLDDYADNWGVGLRLLVMGAPLRVDYGVPINAPDGVGKGGHFWFSFGTRF